MNIVILLLTALQAINTAHSFRDYPANYTESQAIGRLKYDKDCNCTVYEKSFKNILSRKKRWFVFYKGTLVAITNVAAKAILATSPKGIIQSNEVDLFYEVPLLVEGWRQPFNDYITSMRVEKKKFEESEAEEAQDEKLKHVGVVNASAIPLDQYYKMPYARPSWSQNPLSYPTDNYYHTERKNIWNSNRRNYNEGDRKPYNRGPSRYYQNSQRRNYVEPRPQNRNYTPNRQYSTAESNRAYHVANAVKQTNNRDPQRPYHREFRERRDIYDHVEKFGNMLGKSLRKCILRAVCEMKQEMLPEGESFINDVARILFTVPTDHDDKDDEFTKMALEDNVDCARRFMVSCPHSPLQYFFNNFRATDRKNAPEATSRQIMDSLIYA